MYTPHSYARFDHQSEVTIDRRRRACVQASGDRVGGGVRRRRVQEPERRAAAEGGRRRDLLQVHRARGRDVRRGVVPRVPRGLRRDRLVAAAAVLGGAPPGRCGGGAAGAGSSWLWLSSVKFLGGNSRTLAVRSVRVDNRSEKPRSWLIQERR